MANNKPSLAEIAARSRVKTMDWRKVGDEIEEAGNKFAKAYGGWRDSKRRASGNFTEEESNEQEIQEQAKTEKIKEEATEGLNEDDKNKVENKVDEQNSEAEKEEIINKNEEAKEEENESLNLQTFTDIDGNKIQ